MSFPWPSSKRQGARKLRNACHAAFKIIHRAFQMSVAWARHKFRCSEQIECSYSSEYAEIGVHRLAEIVEISTDPIRKNCECEHPQCEKRHLGGEVDRGPTPLSP